MKLFKQEELSIDQQRDLDRDSIAAQTAAFLAQGNAIYEAKQGESGYNIDDGLIHVGLGMRVNPNHRIIKQREAAAVTRKKWRKAGAA